MESQIIIPTELKINQEIQKQSVSVSKAEVIRSAFEPMVKMLDDFDIDYNQIMINKTQISPDLTQRARELRLKMVKVRTGSEKIRKEQKEEYLRSGRAIDGVHNILEWAVRDKEQKLEEIEKHFENIEMIRRQRIFNERLEQIKPFIPEHEAKLIPLADLQQDTFDNLVMGYKTAHEAKIKFEQEQRERIEQERIASEEKEKAEALFSVRLKKLMQIEVGCDSKTQAFVMFDSKTEKWFAKSSESELRTMNDDQFIQLFNEFNDIKLSNIQVRKEASQQREKEERETADEERRQRRLRTAPDKQKLVLFANQLDNLQCLALADSEAIKILKEANEELMAIKKRILIKAEKL